MDPALALHRFKQDGRGVVGQRALERRQVVEGHVGETGYQRLERLAILAVPGGRERAHRPPVKTTHGSDDPGTPRAGAGKLEGSFDGLCARVTQKDAREPGRRHPGQRGQQLRAPVVVEDLRTGDEPGGLLGDRRDDGRMGVPEVGRALPSHAVDVLVAVRIPQASALPAHDGQGALRVDTGGVAGLQREDAWLIAWLIHHSPLPSAPWR